MPMAWCRVDQSSPCFSGDVVAADDYGGQPVKPRLLPCQGVGIFDPLQS